MEWWLAQGNVMSRQQRQKPAILDAYILESPRHLGMSVAENFSLRAPKEEQKSASVDCCNFRWHLGARGPERKSLPLWSPAPRRKEACSSKTLEHEQDSARTIQEFGSESS